MSLKIGIVGLPNVGKSTLFNALTKTKSADAQNYPFCTIDPNVGIVEVPDERLRQLAEVAKSEKILPTAIEFVDIAGLVAGASKGEGLGNKFLSHIRECNAIAHVVRVFDDPNILHVHGKIDPKSDREVIESELILSDVQTVENRLIKANGEAKSGGKEKKDYADLLQRILQALLQGTMASNLDLTEEEQLAIRDLHLLSAKPCVYVVNLHEEELSKINIEDFRVRLGLGPESKIVPICARVEEELGTFSNEEAQEYLSALGTDKTGLDNLIRSAYEALGLITYFTTGPKETRAWTVKKGATCPKAAGVIHTDFEKGFIKAEVVFWEDLVKCGSELKAKEAGRIRLEGKEYIVKDGDTMHFKFAN